MIEHPTVPLTAPDGDQVDIDVELADLLDLVWQAGCHTVWELPGLRRSRRGGALPLAPACLPAVAPRLSVIDFTDGESLCTFMDAAAGGGPRDELYIRMVQQMVPGAWRTGVRLWDDAVTADYAGRTPEPSCFAPALRQGDAAPLRRTGCIGPPRPLARRLPAPQPCHGLGHRRLGLTHPLHDPDSGGHHAARRRQTHEPRNGPTEGTSSPSPSSERHGRGGVPACVGLTARDACAAARPQVRRPASSCGRSAATSPSGRAAATGHRPRLAPAAPARSA